MVVEKVYEELKYVFDPEFGVNVVDLGYIYDVTYDDHRLNIAMTCISENQSVRDRLISGVKFAVENLAGVNEVNVSFVSTPKWNPDMMNKNVKKELIGVGE